VGPGGSQEAPYTLKDAIPAGSWHVVMDAVVIKPVDVTFDLLCRTTGDETIATWMHHFDPKGGADFTAIAYELDVDGAATSCGKGDQLVFRYTGANTTSANAFVPNGDGKRASGRIPSFLLP